jgi:3-hydroxyacyl-CoA dehydrogenase
VSATPQPIARVAVLALKLGLNHPMGPFELVDLVGLDTRLAVLEYLHRTLGEKYRPCTLLVQPRERRTAGEEGGERSLRVLTLVNAQRSMPGGALEWRPCRALVRMGHEAYKRGSGME